MSTITTIQSSDTLAASRAVINTNFSNLNTDKIETSTRKIVYKSANETVTSSTILQDDDHLTFAIGANEVWAFKMMMFYNAGTNPDIDFGWSVPAGTTMKWNYGTNTGTILTEATRLTVFNGIASDTGVLFYGTVVASSTAGNVTLQWAQRNSDGASTTVLSGSHIIAERLA